MKSKASSSTPAAPKAFAHGAEWIRADFHLHTKADKEFQDSGDPNFFNSAYVEALDKAGIRLGVITNHNKFDHAEFKALRSAAKKKKIGLLPGVELSVNEGYSGVHVLIIFGDAWIEGGRDYVNPFISSMFPGKTPQEYEQENGRSDKTLLQMVEALDQLSRDYALVFAHVEEPKGLWAECGLGKLSDWREKRYDALRHRTLGFQKVRSYDKSSEPDKPCRAKAKRTLEDWYPAEVEGSDPKSTDQIGRGRPCYLKLGELSFEAVKFALFDHEHRVRHALPDECNAATIRAIRFEGARLSGVEIPLSASLNCLIGPRGSGKSAVIECCRHALGFDVVGRADEKYKLGLVDSMLTPGGKVVVEASDEFGRPIRVERERSGSPSVFVDGAYREISPSSVLKDFLYFGQKDLSTRSESFDETFLDKLLADRIVGSPQEEQRLIEAVKQAAKQLRETLDATEKLEGYRREANELEVQLQVYTDKGVDKRLQDMTLFDADRQSIVVWQTAIDALAKTLDGFAGDWADAEAECPVPRSNLMDSIGKDLASARNQFAQAKKENGASLSGLRRASETLATALKKLDPTQARLKRELVELQKSLNEPQLDLDLFRKKKARLEQLRKLLDAGAQRGRTEQAARDLLGAAAQKLHEFWRERFQERETEIRKLESELPQDIRIRTAFKGRKNSFEEFLRGAMRGSGLQSTSYESIRDSFGDGWNLYKRRAELDTVLSETAAAKVKAALADQLEAFLTFRVMDETMILFQDKPLGDYSLGQRATVILHILMHLRRHPVIMIDQPEDDLDNETLYSHFIRQLLDRKELTQFIFATHNPNIPVLGDAEQIVVCRKQGDSFAFEHGSIDAKTIQARIVTVMEGGEDAFRRRKEIYQLWKSSN